MLILRRKVGEQIVIGDGIVVVVSRVSGGRVTIGIEAPADVHIVRGELRGVEDPRHPPPQGKAMRQDAAPSASSAAPPIAHTIVSHQVPQ